MILIASSHTDPIATVILWVTVIFFFGVLGRFIAQRFNQPGVLGELLMGVLLGNICYFFDMPLAVILREGTAIFSVIRDLLLDAPLLDAVKTNIHNAHYASQVTRALAGPQGTDLIKVAYVIDIFSRYGVIFLLFMVGLESSVEELKYTGRESIRVAVIGVVMPMLLGLMVTLILMPAASFKSHLFVAATLTATSVGITARVLKEMNKLKTREAKTILGAAMIDDILGLIILAIVTSIVVNNVVNVFQVSQIIILAIAFFVGVVKLGPWILRKTIYFFPSIELSESKLIISFLFLMSLSWLATSVQLASIIGAFAAGIVIHDGFFSSKESSSQSSLSIHNLMAPLEILFTPLFFMLIGIQVKLETFLNGPILMLAGGLIAAAIVGKLLSGLGGGRKDDRLLIGIGMLPRGEVGLVFASIGITLGVISDQLFSAIILMVVVTTIITPFLLKIQFSRQSREISS